MTTAEVMVDSEDYLAAYQTWASDQHVEYDTNLVYTFDESCGLSYIDFYNGSYLFIIHNMKKFQSACLKHAWSTKSCDDSEHDQGSPHRD